jgi:hypothetical protein
LIECKGEIMVAQKKAQPQYYRSLYYQPVLKSLAPRWYALDNVGVAGIIVSCSILPFLIGPWMLVPLVVSFIVKIVCRRKLAQYSSTALLITEHLSKEWFNKNVYGPQHKLDCEREIQRLKSIYFEKVLPP